MTEDEDIVYDRTHPDMDAVIERYIPNSEYSVRSRLIDDEVEYALVRTSAKGEVTSSVLPSNELKALNDEEKATYIILKVVNDRYLKKSAIVVGIVYGIILIFLLVYGFTLFGFDIIQYGEVTFSLAAGLAFIIEIPFCCCAALWNERLVDRKVYSMRPNLMAVFHKLAEVSDNENSRKSYLSRANRLER